MASLMKLSTPSKEAVSSIAIISINSNRSSTESLTSTPSVSYSDTTSMISINSSASSFAYVLEPSIVASLRTSENAMHLPDTMKKEHQNVILSATSDESCASIDGTATAASANISDTTISSEFIVTPLESFVKYIKLTSAIENENRHNSNDYHVTKIPQLKLKLKDKDYHTRQIWVIWTFKMAVLIETMKLFFNDLLVIPK